MKQDALQHTRFQQCAKQVYEVPFCPNFQASQLLINSHILKHEVTRNSLLILYTVYLMFCMT